MLEKDKLLELYIIMQTIRKVEFKIADEYKNDDMKTPIHLSIGQEAISAGVCINLEKGDYAFGTHRSHAQYIAKGGDIKKMIAELYLRKTGCSYGRGGSMHLLAPEVGILGSTAIVGGGLPLGTGTALASKISGDGKVSAVFFGDGAVDEGTFHESLNFAALKKLPVIYICENNVYAINSHHTQRHPKNNIYKWAESYDIPGYQIDGNDVVKVSEYAASAVERCRKGEGPTLLECMTYRWMGHIGTVNDVGEGLRAQTEYDYWLSRCPIRWYSDYLKNIGLLDVNTENSIDSDIDKLVEEAFDFAKSSQKPDPKELMEFVYV
ncbi:MAG: pyruvate/2-oxoglutarate dehydrogenase complex, dehydrogenase component alpha subunit [Eubacterium sp.]|nr:pyruvate/2-oxoglutarate dehydrogenase complex, dehydrogenase component alpha subunit [Eubacterium sp.]